MGFFLNELFSSSNLHVCYFQTIFAIHHILSKPFITISRTHKFPKKVEEKEGKGLQKALKILDFITPKTTRTQVCRNHLRLIQACMQDLVESDQNQQWGSSNCISASSTEISQDMFVEILERDISWTSLYFRMHKEGIVKADEGTLSSALSSCGSVRAVESGIQLHCLGIKTGFDLFVYVGSSLINFYSKCGDLENAYKVFEEMPVRNVVSWTAIISGFAQQLEVEMCLKLYDRMRRSTSKPNDFTLCSILSACTGSGSLGQGRSAHCQTIQMGFDSNTHISNALISMYSKCGNVEEAFYIFEKIQRRDLISWNSMIAGYAQHGLAKKAINLFKEMEKHKIEPDGITFLGVLSSCRHAGFIEQGRVYFNSMFELGVEPDLDHYSCIVDLLGRSGLLEEAREFILKMPICPNEVIWGSLLASCRLHGNVWIGIEAAESRLLLDLSCAATHVQLANLYASAGYWDEAARVRKLMKDRGLKTNPGYSWIEIRNEVYKFRVEDRSNAIMDEIFNVVDGLVDNMRDFGYVPKIHEEAVDL